MNTRLFLLLTIVFSFLQGTVLPVVFTEGVLLTFYVLGKPGLLSSPNLVFAGLIFDFVQNQRLGITSLIFLLTIFLLNLGFERFQINRGYSLGIAATLICALRWKLVYGYLPFTTIVIIFLISFALFKVFWIPVLSRKIKI